MLDQLAAFAHPIQYRRAAPDPAARFSILLPTWNNLALLQCCVDSIRKNSEFRHQIILHINEGADGTRAWAEQQGLDYTFSEKNIGICHAMNAAASLAYTDYIAYLNDDMYCCPGWDSALWQAIQEAGTPDFFISATMIEPLGSGNPSVLAPHDYGRDPAHFDEARLLADLPGLTRPDWSGATWPPNVVPRRLWEQVGGYSVEFTPGMYSDPDFSAKLWIAGVRYFRGVGASRVYHFMSKSTGRVVKPVNGSHLFLRKWGISARAFVRHYLRRGEPWQGPLQAPPPSTALRLERWKAGWKRKFL